MHDRRKLKLPKTLLSIDFPTITVEKNRLPCALYHVERAGIKLHIGFANESGMPLHVVETTGLKTENAVFNKLFSTLIAYVLKSLHTQGKKGTYCNHLPLVGYFHTPYRWNGVWKSESYWNGNRIW